MNTLQNKRVSVIIPNYNYARYIKKRIESVLRQTYPIYELIILDDCSADDSVEKIESVLKKHGLDFEKYTFDSEKHNSANNREEKNHTHKNQKLKVKLVLNGKNSGKAMLQWKKGVELAGGDYVWIAEADDLARSHFLEEVMKGFDEPGVVISYAESEIINSMGLMIAPNFRWSRDKEKTGHYSKSYIKDGADEIREIMAVRCTIPNVSAVVFKKDQNLLKNFDETFKFAQAGDWYLYLKVLESGKIAYNKKSLNKFRVHKRSVTGKNKNTNQHLKEIIEIHEMVGKKYKLSDEVKEYIRLEEERLKNRE